MPENRMRYVRTGEYREPLAWELFERPGDLSPQCAETDLRGIFRWILRIADAEGHGEATAPPIATAVNAVLDASTLPEISDAVEALRKAWRPEE